MIIWDKENWGNITAKTYIQHVILTVHEFWQFKEEYLLIEDGTAAHRAKTTSETYKRLRITKIKWLASSPDLNPIENVWRLLKARLRKRANRLHTLEAMKHAIQEEWEALHLEDYLHYIRSMPERVQAVIAARGGHTKW
jgi:PHD/YefM family antitoxin component YafN of YafNO toxin-antitoxin module